MNFYKHIISFFNGFFIYKPSLKQLFVALCGFLFCGYIFYARVLLKRTENLIEYHGYIFLIILYVLLLIMFLRQLKLYVYPNPSKHPFIIGIKNFLSLHLSPLISGIKNIIEFYNDIFLELYLILVERHKHYLWVRNKILHPNLIFVYNLYQKYIMPPGHSEHVAFYFYFIVVLMPQFIFSFALCLDVIWFKKFLLLSYLWWVLILPMGWAAVFYMQKTFCTRELELFSRYFNISWGPGKMSEDRQSFSGSLDIQYNVDSLFAQQNPITFEQQENVIEDIKKWDFLEKVYFWFYSDPNVSALFVHPFYKSIRCSIAFFYVLTFSYRLWNEIIFYPAW